jgi:hypothetical protein
MLKWVEVNSFFYIKKVRWMNLARKSAGPAIGLFI